MTNRFKIRPTYSNVVATLCLFLVVGGGTAWAVDEFTGENIQDGTLTAADLADNSVNRDELADSSVTAGKINGGAVTTQKVLDNALTGVDLLDGSVAGSEITDDSLTGNDIGTGAVRSSEVENDSLRASDFRRISFSADPSELSPNECNQVNKSHTLGDGIPVIEVPSAMAPVTIVGPSATSTLLSFNLCNFSHSTVDKGSLTFTALII